MKAASVCRRGGPGAAAMSWALAPPPPPPPPPAAAAGEETQRGQGAGGRPVGWLDDADGADDAGEPSAGRRGRAARQGGS